MIICTDKDLEQFSTEHYTYINQIFGDEGVREVIQEMHPKVEWNFVVEDADEAFENSNHHILEKKGKNGETIKWCSVDEGYQNIYINKNDTLCQSYSLLKYLNRPIVKGDMKEIQLEMVRMYKHLLKQEKFKNELCGMIEIMQDKIKNKKKKIHYQDNSVWKDHTSISKPPLKIDFETLCYNIENVLEKWQEYGYLYFINDGKCTINE